MNQSNNKSNNHVNALKGMMGDFTKKIDVLQNLSKVATSQLDDEHLKKVVPMGNDLKQAMKSAMKGDSSELTKFVDKNANIN